MATDRWTHADETKLQSMIKRKDDIMDKNREPILKLAADIEHWGGMDRVDKLIANASHIRDVLEPFDDRGYLRIT